MSSDEDFWKSLESRIDDAGSAPVSGSGAAKPQTEGNLLGSVFGDDALLV